MSIFFTIIIVYFVKFKMAASNLSQIFNSNNDPSLENTTLGKDSLSSDSVRIHVILPDSGQLHIASIELFKKSKMAASGHLEICITLIRSNNCNRISLIHLNSIL